MRTAPLFDTMPHEKLLEVLAQRIADKRFLRLISRMLKSGIQMPAEVVYPEEGSPQGSIVSPVLANIYLHEVLDQWFTETLKPYFPGYCEIIRYADDTLALFEREEDARRFLKVLPLRLAKYGLSLHPEKTKLVPFGKQLAHRAAKQGKRMPTLDFLGFTHYWGKSRQGKVRVKRRTAKKRLKRALVSLNQWLRQERNRLPLGELWEIVVLKVRGHYNYYGVKDNMEALQKYADQVKKSLFKWFNRRSQRLSFTREEFVCFVKRHPLPKPVIRVKLNQVEGRQ